jgi:hypothetical protein
MSEYTSKGQGALNTVLGAIGTAGATGILNGGIGNMFGGCGHNNGCGDSAYVTRYDASKDSEIARLQSQIELRDANFYTLGEMGKLRDYVDGKFARVEHEICDQKVLNATLTSNMTCMASQIAALNSLTKMVVPNASICPGWGDVTVSVTPASTTGA